MTDTEKSARTPEAHRHTPLCGSRDRIVVGIDGGNASRAALRWAAAEARLRHTHLHVVHSYSEYPEPQRTMRDYFRALIPPLPAEAEREAKNREQTAQEELTALLQQALPAVSLDVEAVPVEVESLAVPGPAPESLVAASHGAALLVLGHARDDRHSVARRAAALSTAPVAVVRPDQSDERTHHRILVAVDGSYSGRDALWFAANEALFRTGVYDASGGQREVELRVLDLAPTPPGGLPVTGPARDLLEYLIEEVFENPGAPITPSVDVSVQVETVHSRSEPKAVVAASAQALAALSGTADLLVIGHRAEGTSLPAVVNSVLEHAACPVIVAPAAREDLIGGVHRAELAFERLWVHGQGPALWSMHPEPAPAPAGSVSGSPG